MEEVFLASPGWVWKFRVDFGIEVDVEVDTRISVSR